MLPCWQLTYHITSQFSEAVVKQVKEAADRRAIAHALVCFQHPCLSDQCDAELPKSDGVIKCCTPTGTHKSSVLHTRHACG